MEKRQSLWQMVLGELGTSMQKNEIELPSYSIHKTKLNMGERPKCGTGNHQNLTGENTQQPL